MATQRFLNPEGFTISRSLVVETKDERVCPMHLEKTANSAKVHQSTIENSQKLHPSKKPGSKIEAHPSSLIRHKHSPNLEDPRGKNR